VSEALSPVLRQQAPGMVMFWCKGCDMPHQIRVVPHETLPGPVWGYNGNPEAPTFTPSILVRGSERLSQEEVARVMGGEKIEPRPLVCHSFVTDGQIQFLSDCTHALAGQTVPMFSFPEWWD
jgi:hypothetical protein